MKRVLLIFLLAASPFVSAQIFKWVDADGRTQFSDRPQPDAKSIELKLAAPPAPPSTAAGGATGEGPMLGPYAGFEIVSPAPNETLRQVEDKLVVSLLLDPALIGGHQLEFVLDGTTIRLEKSAGTQLTLAGVSFGSHEAYAQILDSRGAVVARTRTVTFHLRKPIPPGVLP